MTSLAPRSTLFPYTTLFRSRREADRGDRPLRDHRSRRGADHRAGGAAGGPHPLARGADGDRAGRREPDPAAGGGLVRPVTGAAGRLPHDRLPLSGAPQKTGRPPVTPRTVPET